MIITLAEVMPEALLSEVCEALPRLRYEDGRATAGWHAQKVKRNEQARSSVSLDLLREKISGALLAHPVFQMAVRPRALTPLLLSRTAGGGHYGTHVDAAIMGGLRTDVSFTIFLSDPGSYEGGELVMESAAGEDAYKMPPGSAVIYPSGTLHRVSEVTSGERYAAVGWAQSFVRDAGKRELLFDLETAQREVFGREGKTETFDLLTKCSTNLMRRWADC